MSTWSLIFFWNFSATAAAKLPSNNNRIVKKQNTHLDSSYIKFNLEPYAHVVLPIFCLSCQQVEWWSELGTIWNAPYVLQWVSLEFIWGSRGRQRLRISQSLAMAEFPVRSFTLYMWWRVFRVCSQICYSTVNMSEGLQYQTVTKASIWMLMNT